MPRTKRGATSRPTAVKTKNANMKEVFLKKIDDEFQGKVELLKNRMDQELRELHMEFIALRTNFPKAMLNTTMRDIKNGDMALSDVTNTFDATRSFNNTTKLSKTASSRSNTTTTLSSDFGDVNKTKVASKTRILRSISAGCEDEGYTTSESTRGTNSGDTRNTTRQSRSKTKTHPKQSSRSLSRNTSRKVSSFKTPSNKQPLPSSSGTITPKCKPNTPLLYVRRPKIGEMAWSNQGSPLLVTGTVAPENTANVNIPIGGDILSLLPTRGVRESQLPEIDDHTRRQLEILRDNLIKVCHNQGK